MLVKSSVQKSNEDESAPEKYSLTSKARRTKDTLFISLPFIASIPSRFTPSPLPNRFHDFPPLRDKVVPRFRHSRIIENAHVNTVKTKIIFASSSFSLKNRDRERERGGGGKWRNNGACSVLRDYHPKSDPLSQEGETGGSCAISAVRMPHARDPFRRLWIYIQGITRGRTIVSMVFVFSGGGVRGERVGYLCSATKARWHGVHYEGMGEVGFNLFLSPSSSTSRYNKKLSWRSLLPSHRSSPPVRKEAIEFCAIFKIRQRKESRIISICTII